MTAISSPKTEISELSNSFKIISHNDVRKKHTSLCLWIKTGSVRELATNNGIAHLLEHSLFGQYSKNQRSRVYEEIKNNDLKIRAFTTVENTAFFIEHIKTTDIQNCVELLWRIFSAEYLTSQSVKDAKSDIQKELISLSKDTDNKLFQALNSASFPNQTLAMPIAGSWETVSKIHLEDLLKFQEKEYLASNSFLCASGNIHHQNLEEYAEKWFSSLTLKSYSQSALPNWNGGLKSVSIDEENSKLAFSLPFETKKPCDFYYFWLVAFFLSFDHRFAFSSALKNRLRDIIDLLIYPEFFNQIGRMHIYIKTANPITLDTIEIIKQELNLFTRDKIEDLFAELNEIEINKAIDAVKLKDSRVEQLAMSVSAYGIIPSNILIPQWTQNVQSKLKDLMSELNNHHSPAVAYTKTSKSSGINSND